MTPRTPADILREAKRLIEEKGWTQGTYARDSRGEACDWNGATALCFCAEGAMFAAAEALRADAGAECAAGFLIEQVTPAPSIVAYNDQPGRSREDVIAIFDKAIALAEAQP